MNVALLPGTYDPVTVGHLDVIARCSAMFDDVVVAVVDDSFRKSVLFNTDERVLFLEHSTKDLSNVYVRVMRGLVVDVAREVGAHVLVKGLRAVTDFEYEFQLAMMNRRLEPAIETVFLMTGLRWVFLSSSILKEAAVHGGDIEGMVPENVFRKLREKFSRG